MGSHYNLETHWNTISDTSMGKKKYQKGGKGGKLHFIQT